MNAHKRLSMICFSVGLMTLLSAEATQLNFDTQWQKAEDLRLRAALKGYEWRDTEKILRRSREEYKAGNKAQALSLLSQGLEQSDAALAQAAREEDGWKRRVIEQTIELETKFATASLLKVFDPRYYRKRNCLLVGSKKMICFFDNYLSRFFVGCEYGIFSQRCRP